MTNFSKLIKELLKPLPKNDYPALDTFTFLSCWIGFALDKSIVSMRDLCSRMVLQGINVNLSTFSKASKIRETRNQDKLQFFIFSIFFDSKLKTTNILSNDNPENNGILGNR